MAKPPVSPDAQPSIENSDETAARLGITPNAGKGQATPTRKKQEAANKRPLVPDDRKLAAKQARAKSTAARDVARAGMAAGIDKYLPLRERGLQKRYARDYVDARFNVGELMIPIMFLVILLTTIPSVDVYAIFALWAFFILAIIDCVVLGFILTKKINAKFGADNAERIRWYAAMRALQLRPMRLPKPQVKRRQYPV
ncbi:DUF3043 domain-containing protein [Cryobacterium gelidum]|uniref:DUF3043 domain-containing protein n=1 Tax=Cryobacterium gelidum TaxID=1259164 RepID=A0A4R9AZE4_9MICO|nr:DUF3043 domain-containing protein [Cryobacterium gelidum]TFD73084.1 DUF3043 domain-containing protein [Cryobacterium gelidum]